MKFVAAKALAACVAEPAADRILPDPLDMTVVPLIAAAVAQCAAGG